MGFGNFNKLFSEDANGILRPAVIRTQSLDENEAVRLRAGLSSVISSTTAMFVDTQYLLLSILLHYDNPDTFVDSTFVDSAAAESTTEVTMDVLAERFVVFINNQLVRRPALQNIVFGADTHTNVPVMKHAEWNERSHHTSTFTGDTYSAQLRTDFSRSDEALGFSTEGVLGQTLTGNTPQPEELVKDRYTRPLFLSRLFQKVMDSYGPSEELVRPRTFRLIFMHPIFDNEATGSTVENVLAVSINPDELHRERYYAGTHIGEADMQQLFILHELVRMDSATGQQLEIVSNDTDTYITLLFFYLHLKKANLANKLSTYVWGSGKGQVVDVNKMFSSVIPTLFGEKGAQEDKVLMFLVVCMLYYGTDFYDKPSNFSSPADKLDALIKTLVAAKETDGSNYIKFTYTDGVLMPTQIIYQTDRLMCLSRAIYYLVLPSVRRRGSADELRLIGASLLAEKKVTLKNDREHLASLWTQFVENIGGASDSESVRIEHPLYKVVESPELMDGFTLIEILTAGQLKALTLLLLHAFRDGQNRQLYETDHPGRKTGEDTLTFVRSFGETLSARWLTGEYAMKTFFDPRVADSEDHAAAWRLYDNPEHIAKLTSAKTLPAELAPEHHFFKAGKVEWLIAYLNAGHLIRRNYIGGQITVPTDTVENLETMEIPADGQYVFSMRENPQFEPLIKLGGLRLIRDPVSGETVHVVRQEDSILARKVMEKELKLVTVVLDQDAPLSDSINLGPLLSQTGLFLSKSPAAGLAIGTEAVAASREFLVRLRAAYRMEMLALTTHTGNAWIDDFCRQMASLRSESGEYPNEQLLFVRILAQFFVDRDKSRSDFFLQPMPAFIGASRFCVPTCRLSAAELDAGVDMQTNSVFPCAEYKIGLDFGDQTTLKTDEQGESVVNRGALFQTDTCVASGVVAEVRIDNIDTLITHKNRLTTPAYYRAKMQHGAAHSMVQAREMLNTILSERERAVSLARDKAFMHVAKETPWTNALYDSMLSSSLDVCTYALPLLRYKHDVASQEIWEKLVVPNLSEFKKYMQASFLSFIDWKLWLKATPELVIPVDQYVPAMRLVSATWPMAVLRYFGGARDFNINDGQHRAVRDPAAFKRTLSTILSDADIVCAPLCYALPSAKNMFVMLDKTTDGQDALQITLLFKNWQLPTITKYLAYAHHRLNDGQAWTSFISNPSITLSGTVCPIIIIKS